MQNGHQLGTISKGVIASVLNTIE